MKEAVSPTSFRLPKSLLIELREKCARRELKQGEAVVQALVAWLGEEPNIDTKVEWFLESLAVGLAGDMESVMSEEGRTGLKDEVLLALWHWISAEAYPCRNEDIVQETFSPDEEADMNTQIQEIVTSGDIQTIKALSASVSVFYRGLQPVSVQRRSGS